VLLKSLPLAVVPAALLLGLTACSGNSDVELLPIATDDAATATATATAEATPSAVPDATETGAVPAADGASPAGARAGLGEPLVYSFTGTENNTVLVSSKLLDVTPATPEQDKFVREQFGSDVDGFDLYLIHLEETKVSGDPVEFEASYTGYSPVNADGEEVQEATLIGWDDCKENSFTEEFDNGQPITQCLLAATPTEAAPPAGVSYDGGLQENSPYDEFSGGAPLLFIAG
jgi:hypothetical protein